MQNSAFKFHSDCPELNTLEYFFNLKSAKSQLKKYSKDDEDMLKEYHCESQPDTFSSYEIFNVCRNKIYNKNK